MRAGLVSLVLLLGACASTPPASQAPAAPVRAPIDGVDWLTGVWVTERDGALVEEYWTPPGGGLMLGAGREVREGKLVSFEHLRIVEREHTLVYVALPLGQGSTDFTLVKLGETEAVFENLAHDFPQRIHYRLDGEALVARIEGAGAPAMEWRFERAQ